MRGHIRQRGPSTYQLIYWIDGKQKAKTVHATRREAEAALATIIADLNRGQYVEPAKETFGAYLLRWLDEVKPSIRPSTHRLHEVNCRLYVIPALGKQRLTDIKPLDLQGLYRKLLDGGRVREDEGRPKGLSRASVHSVHRTIRRALNQAVQWGLLAQNPAQRVRPPTPDRLVPRTLTVEQAQKLLQAAKPTGRASLYLAALSTGMRQGELLALRWQDVDLEAGVLFVRQQVAVSGGKVSFMEVKTASSRRSIAIPRVLIDALRDEWKIEDQLRKHLGSSEYDLVWHVPSGKPISPRNLNRQFKLLLKRAGLPDMRFHDLRHTHATWLLEAGRHPRVVQERLGHSQVSVTLNTYSHVVPHLQREAAQDIDNLFR